MCKHTASDRLEDKKKSHNSLCKQAKHMYVQTLTGYYIQHTYLLDSQHNNYMVCYNMTSTT